MTATNLLNKSDLIMNQRISYDNNQNLNFMTKNRNLLDRPQFSNFHQLANTNISKSLTALDTAVH